MPSKPRKPSSQETTKDPKWEHVDRVVVDLTEKLGALTTDLVSQTEKFFESLRQLKLQEKVAPNLERVRGLIAEHDEIAKRFGEKVENLKEEKIVASDQLAQISQGFLQQVATFGSAIDEFKSWQREFRQLIGEPPGPADKASPVRLSFNSLLTGYMGQIQFLGGIVANFGVKVQACEACMDCTSYETLIKSYEEVLKNEGDLLSTVESLLKSKNEMMSQIAKDQEDLLKSYEELAKSSLEVEDKRLELDNKPLRKEEEFAKSYQDLVKSSIDILASLEEILYVKPAQIVEEFLKSAAEVLKAIEDLIKSIMEVSTGGRRSFTANPESAEAIRP